MVIAVLSSGSKAPHFPSLE
uniref:Uncharacterized protein n=1 Tax=Arundo donax TaxID=35708 RepID=A0A0A9FJX4_ARUDO